MIIVESIQLLVFTYIAGFSILSEFWKARVEAILVQYWILDFSEDFLEDKEKGRNAYGIIWNCLLLGLVLLYLFIKWLFRLRPFRFVRF